MANYKEQSGNGVSWTRARQVIINNPYGENSKHILFAEEAIATVNDQVFKNDTGFVKANFNPDTLIHLRDPVTGELTGNVIPQSLVYQALYSLYIQTAEERDSLNQINGSVPNLQQMPVSI